MAWALRAADRSIVHVSQVSTTGLGCGCVCAGCGAELEAVNADKPPEHFLLPGTLRKSFRHHAGTQRGDCLRRSTQAAIFQTMLDRKLLAMPRRHIKRSYAGVSGRAHPGEAIKEAAVQSIAGVLWSDAIGALITLEDGRIVHLVLRTDVAIDPRGAAADAVLVITADDPEVAGWSPDEILAKAQLVEGWCRWERHWDDEALAVSAAVAARDTALQRLDALTREDDIVMEADEGLFAKPEFLEGLTQAQRGETLLHLHLKRLLASLSMLEVGSMQFPVDYVPPLPGRPLVGSVTMPGLRLRISQARLEQRLGMIVPDVLCRAEDMSGELPPTELIVEVAVTHFVGPEKLAKIQALDMPCLEFDARRLVGGNAILTMDRLEHLLRRPPQGAVRWLHHPHLREQIDDMRNALRVRFEAQAAEQAAAQRRRQEAERLEAQREAAQAERRRQLRVLTSRVQVMDRRTLLREYFNDAVQRRPVFDHYSWSDEGYEIYRSGFIRHKLEHWSSAILQDVLVALHSIRQAGSVTDRPDLRAGVLTLLDRAVSVDKHRMRPYLFLLLKEIKLHWASDVDDMQRATVRRVAHTVKASIDGGQAIYAREPALDEPLRILFPELREALTIGVPGTLGYANDLAEELHASREKRRVEREALEAQQAEERSVRQAEAIEMALAPARPRQWTRGGGVAFERWSMYPNTREMSGLDASLIRQAYEAREANQTVVEFVRAKRITNEAGVRDLLAVLNKVYLLT